MSSSYLDYRRLYLTQLPRAIKNRNIDHQRQRLRTSNEEYGRFWTTAADEERQNATFPWSYDRERLRPFYSTTAASQSGSPDDDDYRYRYDGRSTALPRTLLPVYDDDDDDVAPRVTLDDDVDDDDDDASKTARGEPPLPSTSSHFLPAINPPPLRTARSKRLPPSKKTDLMQHDYRLSIAVADDARPSSVLSIARADVRLRLRDRSTVTITDVPLTFSSAHRRLR